MFPSVQFAIKCSDLLTLKPRNVGWNCSVIRLQLIRKVHQPTSKWSWLKVQVIVWLHGHCIISTFRSPQNAPTPYPSCALCLAAHIYSMWTAILFDKDEQNIIQESSHWWTYSLDFLGLTPDTDGLASECSKLSLNYELCIFATARHGLLNGWIVGFSLIDWCSG